MDVLGGEHAVIHPDIPVVANNAYLIDGTHLHPGDSFTPPPAPVDVLFLPTGAPWLKLSEAVDYLRAVGAAHRGAHPRGGAGPAGHALPDVRQARPGADHGAGARSRPRPRRCRGAPRVAAICREDHRDPARPLRLPLDPPLHAAWDPAPRRWFDATIVRVRDRRGRRRRRLRRHHGRVRRRTGTCSSAATRCAIERHVRAHRDGRLPRRPVLAARGGALGHRRHRSPACRWRRCSAASPTRCPPTPPVRRAGARASGSRTPPAGPGAGLPRREDPHRPGTALDPGVAAVAAVREAVGDRTSASWST